MSRMVPASPPYPASIQSALDKIMPAGVEPLHLFRVLARDERLFSRFFGASLLDRGQLSLREREIVILRVCANNRSEYEWGVHVTFFAERAGLGAEQVAATLEPGSAHAAWTPRDQLLVRLCDELQRGTTVSDALWTELCAQWSDAARLELLMLVGFYRLVSTLTNTLQMPLEAYAARFPA
ncbi:MAG TPA: carboxymuconolactone decarboxylase family protein [Polyangiales bacterium]|nr:carboxymuconolactone decarboxylase family protein [Polyangiales bacterium]